MTAEQRWNRAWALAPLGLLLVAGAVHLAVEGFAGGLTGLGVAAGLAAWHWWFVPAHPQWPERRLWIMVGYFAGLLGFVAVLLRLGEAFQIFVPACYVLAFVALPGRAAYLGVVAANLPILLTGGSVLINLALVTPLAAAVGTMIRVMEREAVRRREDNAALTAMAAENARLAREAGVAAERARLAREIHDTVAQGLTGIVTQLSAIDDVPAPARRRLDTAAALARTSLEEVRRSIDALRPGPLEHAARLGDALEQAVAAFSAQYEVPARLTVTGDAVPMHPEVEVTLLRAAQEALSNVGRHARAGRASVTLSYMEDVIVLDVRDDGAGFRVSSAGFGLTALRERVSALSGSVEIESAPGSGTAVSVTVPVIRP